MNPSLKSLANVYMDMGIKAKTIPSPMSVRACNSSVLSGAIADMARTLGAMRRSRYSALAKAAFVLSHAI
jgi:hypothetical protein